MNESLKPGPNHDVTVTASSDYWFDDEGILCAVIRRVQNRSIEERKVEAEKFFKKIGEKKVCMLIDISDAGPNNKENRAFNAEALPKMFKAIAFISRSALGKMIAHLYLGLRPNNFPTKIFSNENDARVWLKQYL